MLIAGPDGVLAAIHRMALTRVVGVPVTEDPYHFTERMARLLPVPQAG